MPFSLPLGLHYVAVHVSLVRQHSHWSAVVVLSQFSEFREFSFSDPSLESLQAVALRSTWYFAYLTVVRLLFLFQMSQYFPFRRALNSSSFNYQHNRTLPSGWTTAVAVRQATVWINALTESILLIRQ